VVEIDTRPPPTPPLSAGVVVLALLALLACFVFAVVPQIVGRCPPPPPSPPQRMTRPAILPVPGAEANSLAALPGGAILFTTTAGLDEVRRYYATTLAAQGWRVAASDGLPYDDRACPSLALRLTIVGQEGARTTYRAGMDETPCAVPPC